MDDHIDYFLSALENDKGFSVNTIAAYRNDLNQFSAYLCSEHGVRACQEVTDTHLTGYVLYLRERSYANSTVARKVAAVKSFCGYLIEQSVLRYDPASKLPSPRVDKFVPRAISEEEIVALLNEPTKNGSPEGLRDKAMLETLYATGMRVSELTALDLPDIDLLNREIRCGTKPDRTRWIALNDDAAEALRAYLEIGRPLLQSNPDQTAVFLNHRGSRLTRQGFWLILKAHAEAANISDITPHTIRHTYAAHALSRGLQLRDVQRILGHMSISTTQIYQQLATEVGAGLNGRMVAVP